MSAQRATDNGMKLKDIFIGGRPILAVIFGNVGYDGPFSVQANALKLSVDRYVAGKQMDVKSKLLVTHGSFRQDDGSLLHSIELKVGKWWGHGISGAFIADDIRVGSVDESGTSEKLVVEQAFKITEIEAAMRALNAISDRELATKKCLKIVPATHDARI